MLAPQDEASFLIKKKYRENKGGEQFPAGLLTVREAGLLLQHPLWRRSLMNNIQNHFYRIIWGLPVQADVGFKDLFAPLSSVFRCKGVTVTISEGEAW